MGRLEKWIKSTKIFRTAVHWLSEHSLPGFGGIPIYDIISFVRQELHKESLILRANAMAYSFFLSLFPSIIVLFTLLPYLPIEGLVQALKNSLNQVLPVESANYLTDAIEELTSIPRSGLLSIGLLLTLFFASNGMISLLRGFEKRYAISYKTRSPIHRRIVALQLTVLLGLLLVSSIVFIVLGRTLADSLLTWAHVDNDKYNVILILRWFATIVIFYTGISILYRYGPALKKRMRFFSPGASLATLLSILSSWGFAYYVNQFDTYNKFYGSLGALIVLMLWLQINSSVILIGYELNASIIVNKAMRKKLLIDQSADTEDPDS
jgi:membrane protein